SQTRLKVSITRSQLTNGLKNPFGSSTRRGSSERRKTKRSTVRRRCPMSALCTEVRLLASNSDATNRTNGTSIRRRLTRPNEDEIRDQPRKVESTKAAKNHLGSTRRISTTRRRAVGAAI